MGCGLGSGFWVLGSGFWVLARLNQFVIPSCDSATDAFLTEMNTCPSAAKLAKPSSRAGGRAGMRGISGRHSPSVPGTASIKAQERKARVILSEAKDLLGMLDFFRRSFASLRMTAWLPQGQFSSFATPLTPAPLPAGGARGSQPRTVRVGGRAEPRTHNRAGAAKGSRRSGRSRRANRAAAARLRRCCAPVCDRRSTRRRSR